MSTQNTTPVLTIPVRIEAEERLNEVKEAVNVLVANRREEAGEQTEVLVNRTEEKEVIELEGVTEARESTRLTDF